MIGFVAVAIAIAIIMVAFNAEEVNADTEETHVENHVLFGRLINKDRSPAPQQRGIMIIDRDGETIESRTIKTGDGGYWIVSNHLVSFREGDTLSVAFGIVGGAIHSLPLPEEGPFHVPTLVLGGETPEWSTCIATPPGWYGFLNGMKHYRTTAEGFARHVIHVMNMGEASSERLAQSVIFSNIWIKCRNEVTQTWTKFTIYPPRRERADVTWMLLGPYDTAPDPDVFNAPMLKPR